MSRTDDLTVEEALAGMSRKAKVCRNYRHPWQPISAKELKKGKRRVGFEQTLRCRECGTLRHDRLNSWGGKESYSYTYAEGYLLKGVGRLGEDYRDALRLDLILESITEVEQVE